MVAAALDESLHARHLPLDLHGKSVVVVDDGLATGATMIAALRWARAGGAARVVAAVAVALAESLRLTLSEADEVFCPRVLEDFFAVGVWYRSFDQFDDEAVIQLLDENRRNIAGSGPGT